VVLVAVVKLAGTNAHLALSEGTVAVNDAATLDSGLIDIRGGGIFVVATYPPERHVSIRDISASLHAALVFDVTLSLGAACTLVVTVAYIFTGSARGLTGA
jgi:hypothetical protein